MKKYFLIMCIALFSCSNEEIGELDQTDLSTNRMTVMEESVIEEVNNFRNSKGLISLEYDDRIYTYAEQQTQYMIKTGNIVHNNFESRASLLSETTNAEAVSENVAKNYPDASSVVLGWISSEGHLKNILGDYTHTAVCVAKDAEEMLYYTQIFYKSSSE